MSNDPHHLARSRSVGAEKRVPPPIKPKPSILASPPTDTSAASTLTPSHQQRSSVTVTDNGAPASSSFGDLRKTFERQQNHAPLFMGSGNAQGTGARAGVGAAGAGLGVSRGSTSAGQLNHASISRVQQHNSSTSQLSPSFGNNVNSAHNTNRPRSVSSPGPPLKEGDHDDIEIDNSQPDFSNLRARFQSQMSLSNSGASKPDTPRPKPKPVIGAKPATASSQQKPTSFRMSVDSIYSNKSSNSVISVPRSVPPQPAQAEVSSVSASRLSSNSFKQAPRPPPPMNTQSPAPRTPTPPRTPPRVETPESERNPFMGSDEDEASASASTAPPIPSRANSSSSRLSSSRMHQNPVIQKLSSQVIGQPMTALAGRDSVLVGKVAPPPPVLAAPRPDSPQGLPPKLPSRANSAILSTPDTPEERERKHRLDKRRRVVQELLETEISFSKDMLLLEEVYVSDMSDSPLFTQADEKIIFTNLADVVALTLDFIAYLTPACGGGTTEDYDDSTTFVGEAFLQMISRIRRVYSEYCKRQEASAQHLQDLENRKDLKPFWDACTEKCKGKTTGWDLASLLIKPVQRVLKYPLLINQIHALTPSGHQDFESLVTVQKEMLQVAEEINEIKKRKDIVEKIVGSKKKNDSDDFLRAMILYRLWVDLPNSHGFNKKFARTTQQLRQAVGGSEVTVDILFEALLEKFNLQQRLVREFAKYIQSWLVSIKQFFDTQEAFSATLADIYGMVPIHRAKENQSLILVQEFHKNLAQFSKTIGRELESRLKKTVYKSIERFLKLFSGPLQVMKKREKKLLDYDNVRGMKDRGETIDKNMLDSAEAYTAINEQLVDELPKFLGLTTQYFDIIVMEFSQVQQYFYTQVKSKNHEFYIEHVDSTCSRDLAAYLDQMDICEDYIAAMTRNDGPLERLNRISLIHDVSATHETAFQNMRDAVEQRLRNDSRQAQTLSRSSSTASPLPTTPGKSTPSWHSPSGSQASLQSPLQPQPRFYPGEDENPFEVPESIFHDGSVTSQDDYEPFGNSHSNSFGGDRPLSMASTYSFASASTDQQEFRSKPPELDDGVDMDEIGIAQALFECTAIYPYSSTEDRQLNFEAGESIVVFGLNDNGWYFGKKVGKDTIGWFPASHCIQI
ncbi:hypothetical protein BGZ95_002298 [Linnemannia exigua]|uniref:Dynamin-binding protein n=1 Tax=Linnemannia exigua TaxID=604196 RepID=A0AAD4D7E3_9FUNG|nr:hypothetical protein BGZ95_002298 [Linnemannia exigua]